MGDCAVGKTSMLITYTFGSFPTEYMPNYFDTYSKNFLVEDNPVSLHIHDTAGQEDNDRFRPLSCPGTDVFLICFSVISQSSFQNVRTKWLPEIQHFCPEVSFILVGTEIDLRNDERVLSKLEKQGEAPITFEQGEDLAMEINAANYAECSSLTQEGLEEVFEKTAIEAALHGFASNSNTEERNKKCVLL